MNWDALPLFALVPLTAALLIPAAYRAWRHSAEVLTFAATVTVFLGAVWYMSQGKTGSMSAGQVHVVWDGFSGVLLVTIASSLLACVLFSMDIVAQQKQRYYYYSLFSAMAAGMTGAVLAADLFTMYIFIELAAVSAYVLISHGSEIHGNEAATKGAMLGISGSALTLVGLALLYRIAGSLDMGAVARNVSTSGTTAVAAGFVLAGLAIKSGLVPFHGWFTDASEAAPAPIAALICGPLSKTIGVYAIVRIFVNVLPATSLFAGLLIAVGFISLVGGALSAAGTVSLRRLPAFLSLSDNGLVIVVVGVLIQDHVSNASLSHGMTLALIGAVFHIFTGGISSVMFHLANGAAEFANGGRSAAATRGAGRSLPTVGVAVAAGALSSAGIPPFAGFWSRLLIISGLFMSGHPVIGGIALLAAIPILIAMGRVYEEFFSQMPKASPEKRESLPSSMSIPLLLLSLTVLVVGIVWVFAGVSIFQPGADALSELTSHFGFLR